MTADAVGEVKRRLDIVDVIAGYVRLQKSGREHKGLCPFHSERTPSFTVSQDRQAWYCFGCQQGGDVLTFVQRIENLDFLPALELLAERAGVEVTGGLRPGAGQGAGRRRARTLELNRRAQAFYEHVLWETEPGAPGRRLLAERGVTEETARRFGLGFAPAGGAGGDALVRYLVARSHGSLADAVEAGLAYERGGGARDRFRHRLVFPIRDERGTVIAFGGRALGDAVPKYLNSPSTAVYDKSTALFGVDLARPAMSAEGSVVLVEGYFDVIAAHAAGVRHVVASSGTALTAEQARALGRMVRTVVLCFDSDEAGRAAASRAVDVIAAAGLEGRICVLPAGFKDPDELVRANPAAFPAAVAAARPEWEVLLDRALEGAEGGSVSDRRAGVERSVAVLARIPSATTRDLYEQGVANRLGLDPAALRADVESVRGRPGDRPRVRLTARAPATAPPAAAPTAGETAPLTRVEAYLATLLLQRPGLAAALRDDHGLEMDAVTNEKLRRVMEVAAGVPAGEPFPLHLLGEDEQRVAAPLLMRTLPELAEEDAASLDGVLADCVRSLRRARYRLLQADVRRRMRSARDEGRSEEAALLLVQLRDLSAAAQRL